jgi:hypothetical protein
MNADIVKLIIVLLVFVVPAVFRMLTKIRQAQEAGELPRQPQAPANRPPRAPGKPVQDEIEEFLARVVEARKAKDPSAGPRKQRRSATPVRPPRPIDAQVVEAKPVGGSVDAFVKQHLDSSQITQRAAHMGEGVAQADQKFDKRLQQTFEHRLGSLENSVAAQSSPSGDVSAATVATAYLPSSLTPASALAALLSNPEAVRNAILMQEILQRPEQRWE